MCADNSSPESGEVRRGLNGRMYSVLVQTTPGPIPEQARLPVAFPNLGGEFLGGAILNSGGEFGWGKMRFMEKYLVVSVFISIFVTEFIN